jgi:hypothetical protein
MKKTTTTTITAKIDKIRRRRLLSYLLQMNEDVEH